MTYTETLGYLYALQKFGMKLGLRNIKSLLRSVGNPQDKFPSVHIAGTNGKGSTAAMTASILQAAGYKVGLYTSPHLISFTERIKIKGQEVDGRRVASYVRLLKPSIDELKATFFEATTAIAFLYFADEDVDIAVIETGLGGRLDATNVLHPLLSVITNISLEHSEHLGNSLGSIAREKAGIMKPGAPCLVGPLEPTAERSIRLAAKRKGVTLISAGAASDYRVLQEDLSGLRVRLMTQRRIYRNLAIDLSGSFQVENARLSVLGAEMIDAARAGLRSSDGRLVITARDVINGLRSVKESTGFHGRLELVRKRPKMILDVAHNADAAAQLVQALENLALRNFIVIFGVMKDKNYSAMLQSLSRITTQLIAVAPRIDRALESASIAATAQRFGIHALNSGSVKKGVACALGKATPSDTILITGSHYVVGEALQALSKLK
jgi:dihydrofolate synthase/folylpolyglutamate synthase